jgi:hypothetical protein
LRKPLRLILLLHTPALSVAVILGVYSLDSLPFGRELTPQLHAIYVLQLLPFALALTLLQLGIWFWLAARRFGWRRAIVAGAAIVLALTGARHISGRIGLRGVDREVVVDSPALYRCGHDAFMFCVSPDERWLIYARESGETGEYDREIPEIVVRDLESGEESGVDVDVVPRGRRDTVADEVVRALVEPHWVEGAVRLPIRAKLWLEIDPASARARPLSSREVRRVRPSAAAFQTYLSRPNYKGGTFGAAVAWDGATVGRYIYATVRIDKPLRTLGAIERSEMEGDWERVVTRREMFANWYVREPVVSPDGRFVAYTGSRSKLSDLFLQRLIPLFGFASLDRDYLFVYDTQSGRDYHLGRVKGVSSAQWSGDSRRLYYAELDRRKERRIGSIHFDVPPSEPVEGRTPWPAPGKRGGPIPDSYTGWESYSVGGVSFRYPAGEVVLSDREGVVTLEHAVDFAHPLPCAGTEEVDRLTDFLVTLTVVERSYRDLVPRETRRGRPGYREDVIPLARCFRVVEGRGACWVERWYCPIDDARTLVVARQDAWMPGRDDPLRDAYLGLDGKLDSKRAGEIFRKFANSIEVSAR